MQLWSKNIDGVDHRGEARFKPLAIVSAYHCSIYRRILIRTIVRAIAMVIAKVVLNQSPKMPFI